MATWNPQALADLSKQVSSSVVRLLNPSRRQLLRNLVDSEAELALLETAVSPWSQMELAFARPTQHESRFRGSFEPGVLYGAMSVSTAMAETGYHRWRFLLDSPGLEETIITLAELRFDYAGLTLNTALESFDRDREELEHGTNYLFCQTLAMAALEAELAGISYQSIRDKNTGQCLAVLRADSVSKPSWGSWHSVYISIDRVEFRTPTDVVGLETSFWR